MSITSLILSLAIFPLRPLRPRPTKTECERKLEADIRRLSFALDYWRNAATALMAENERLHQERNANAQTTQAAAQYMQMLPFQDKGPYPDSILTLNHFICKCAPSRASVITQTNYSN
jgi:hypothetical protein